MLFLALKDLYRSLFGPRTVAACVSTFRKTLDDLQEVEFYHVDRAAEKRGVASSLLSEANDHDNEANRALVIARRINQIVGN